MAQAFDAGSIFVNLRTRTKEWRAGFKQAGTVARRFGDTMRAVGTRLRNVGRAMRGFGKTLTTRVTLPIMKAFGIMAKAMDRQVQAEAQLDAAIRSTGGVANVTAEHVKGLASSIQEVTTFGDEAIIEMASLGLTFTNVKNQGEGLNAVFDRTVRLATDVAAAKRMDLVPAMLLVGKAINDPVRGLKELTRVGITFTKEQKKQIKELAEGGNLIAAQGIVLDELNKKFEGTAKALAKKGLGPLFQAFNALRTAAEEFGRVMEPAIKSFADWLKDLAKWLGGLPDAKKRVVLVLAAITAAIAPLLVLLGSMVTQIGIAIPALAKFGLAMHAALGPIGLVAIALGAVTLALTDVLAGHIAGTKQMRRYAAEAQRLSKTMDGLDAVLDESRNTLVIKFGDALRAYSESTNSAEFGTKKWWELGLAVEAAALKIENVKTLGEGILRQAGVSQPEILRFKEAAQKAIDEAQKAIDEAKPLKREFKVSPTPAELARRNAIMRNFRISVSKDQARLAEDGRLAWLRMQGAVKKFGTQGREDLQLVVEEAAVLKEKLKETMLAMRGAGTESYDILFEGAEDIIRKLDELRRKLVDPPKIPPKVFTSEHQALADSVAQAGQAIGQGIIQGLEQGKKGMEIVADIGRQLFVSAGNKAIEQLTKEAGTAIAKWADTSAELVQGIMNTALAVVGFILSQLDKGVETVSSFADLAPEVESSQLVRGIVAGPQNVAIAEVGENISTAFQPTNEWLAAIHGLIQDALLTVGLPGGGGGGGGEGSAGRTNTP